MPSLERASPAGPLGWLMAKEWRELAASYSWWILLALIGPLVGFSFIGAVRTYGEASGLNGTAQGVGEAFSPLVGIWAPTFSACELAAVFLLPFVAIRLFAGDRQSGALKIEMQHRLPSLVRVGAKAIILLAAWLIASAAPLIAILLWTSYGGSLYLPEISSVWLGHMLNAALTIALAASASSIAEHPSTAAIITLGVTVGTWMINFVAAVQGGAWEAAAGYTPTTMAAQFQHGLVRLDVVVAATALAGAGVTIAAIWLRLGVPARRRALESVVVGVGTAAALALATLLTASWDLSENRGNSLARADEEALERVRPPLRIEVHLAPEDPRRADFDRRALARLRRVLPGTEVRYVSATSIGLFEQTAPQYGEIWYESGGQRTMTRATTTEGMLEAVYDVSGVAVPAERDDDVFRGHPLAARPKGAAALFYVAWPSVVVAGAVFLRRRHS